MTSRFLSCKYRKLYSIVVGYDYDIFLERSELAAVKNPASIRTFGQHLRKLREERGLSLQMLADESNTSKPTLFRIETARATPTLDLLVSLARAMGVTVQALVAIPGLETLDEE